MVLKVTRKKAVQNKHNSKSPYVSRAKAIARLSVSQNDFRRLCILKGIYPVIPDDRHLQQGVYYYAKDLTYLLHEPLLERFRKIKSHIRKLRRRRARNEWHEVEQLAETVPQITLDHLVRERYPTFTDALMDLDDALSCVHLFACCSGSTEIPQKVVQDCLRLTREWQYYVVRAGVLRKSFISIKGIYFGANVQGVDVSWLMPHPFAVRQSGEVDYSVMETFLLFYRQMLGFVLYRLYSQELHMSYPPGIDTKADVDGAWLSAFATSSGVSLHAEGRLFSDLTFYINREVPARHTEFLLMAYGANCIVETPLTADKVKDMAITHQIVDRPVPQSRRVPGRTYVQPQWVYDSANAGILLPVEPYEPGHVLPPHLSPFVQYSTDDGKLNPDTEAHIPARALEIQRLVAAHNSASAAPQEEVSATELSVAAARQRLQETTGRAALALPGQLEDDIALARSAVFLAEVNAELTGERQEDHEEEPAMEEPVMDQDDFLGQNDGSEDAQTHLPPPMRVLDIEVDDAEPEAQTKEDDRHIMLRELMSRNTARKYNLVKGRLDKRDDHGRMLDQKARAIEKSRKH